MARLIAGPKKQIPISNTTSGRMSIASATKTKTLPEDPASSLASAASTTNTMPITTLRKTADMPNTATAGASTNPDNEQLQTFAIRKHCTFLHIQKLAFKYIEDNDGLEFESEGELPMLIGACDTASRALRKTSAFAGDVAELPFRTNHQITVSSIVLQPCFAQRVRDFGLLAITENRVDHHLGKIKEKLKLCAGGVDVYGPL